MTPERRLLLSCCRASISEKDDEKIRTFSYNSFDWNAFLKLVDRHRVYPFVYRHLAGSAPGKIPSYAVKGLIDRVEKKKRHTLKLCSKLRYKLKCLTSLYTSPRDWSFLRLPDLLFPLYFILRPFLWFWRWFLIRRLPRFSQIDER
jgi:hypothetical protein